MNGSVVTAKSSRGSVTFDGSVVTIRQGMLASGGRGEHQFSLAQVSGVRIKRSVMTAGAFTLVVSGGSAPRANLMARHRDPLTVEFTTWGAQREFMAVRDAIMSALNSPPAGAAPRTPTLEGDLAALVDLRNRGILTQAEWQAATGRLVGYAPQ